MQLGIRIPSQAVHTELHKMGLDATSSLVINDYMIYMYTLDGNLYITTQMEMCDVVNEDFTLFMKPKTTHGARANSEMKTTKVQNKKHPRARA